MTTPRSLAHRDIDGGGRGGAGGGSACGGGSAGGGGVAADDHGGGGRLHDCHGRGRLHRGGLGAQPELGQQRVAVASLGNFEAAELVGGDGHGGGGDGHRCTDGGGDCSKSWGGVWVGGWGERGVQILVAGVERRLHKQGQEW